jgi:hypothetical protein
MIAKRGTASGTGILSGVDGFIERHLGVAEIGARSPRYHNLSACRNLSGAAPLGFDAEALIEDIFLQVEMNWRASGVGRNPSIQNWRFEKQLNIAAHNQSPEKTLEKAIAESAGETWANQVPTASGLVNATSDRSRNLDLVFRVDPGRFEFIELKLDSDTPLYAAIEMLEYGVLYLFYRLNFLTDARNNVLLTAKTVHLRVLAPAAYYRGYRFEWLESELTRGLQAVIEKRGGPMMDFMFTAFPDDFNWPCPAEQMLASLGRRASVEWQS